MQEQDPNPATDDEPVTYIFQGNPMDIGSESFMKIMGPIVLSTRKALPPDDFLDFYAGIFTALYGGISAHFGQDQADQLIKDLLSTFGGVELSKEWNHVTH